MFYNVGSVYKRSTYNAACFATEYAGKYHVHCLYCYRFIGILTGSQIATAIRLTVGRGGVLCPECRKETCDFCGVTTGGGYELGLMDGLRACKLCQDEQSAFEDELEQDAWNF